MSTLKTISIVALVWLALQLVGYLFLRYGNWTIHIDEKPITRNQQKQ